MHPHGSHDPDIRLDFYSLSLCLTFIGCPSPSAILV